MLAIFQDFKPQNRLNIFTNIEHFYKSQHYLSKFNFSNFLSLLTEEQGVEIFNTKEILHVIDEDFQDFLLNASFNMLSKTIKANTKLATESSQSNISQNLNKTNSSRMKFFPIESDLWIQQPPTPVLTIKNQKINELIESVNYCSFLKNQESSLMVEQLKAWSSIPEETSKKVDYLFSLAETLFISIFDKIIRAKIILILIELDINEASQIITTAYEFADLDFEVQSYNANQNPCEYHLHRNFLASVIITLNFGFPAQQTLNSIKIIKNDFRRSRMVSVLEFLDHFQMKLFNIKNNIVFSDPS